MLLGHGRLSDRLGSMLNRLRRRSTTPAPPCIERLAADLRRLSAAMLDPTPRSAVQRRAVAQAYEQILRSACAALDVRHDLDAQTGQLDREIERTRMEAELEAAGLVIRRPAGRDCGRD